MTEREERVQCASTGRRSAPYDAVVRRAAPHKAPCRGNAMTANDAIVLKTNFESWKQQAGDLGGLDPWLYYCLEQFLKPYALDDEEVQYGVTEGGGDGGSDGIYFLVNQRQLVTEDTDLEPKGVSKVRLIFLQIKSSGGFKPTQIERWIQLTDDFLDLSKSPDSFGTRYNDKVKTLMRVWKEQFLRISGAFAELSIDYFYITPDDVFPDDYARDAGERVKAKAQHHVKATCAVHYVGAQELWKQVQRRPPKSKTLKWSESPMSTVEGFVGLVKLSDFRDFLEDEPDVIAERIFESNVRGYQPDSKVNEGIFESLEDQQGSVNFWLLSNGVTIIAPKAAPVGHLRLEIEDPQIVNGLQTSRVIFAYFQKHKHADDKRTVVIRVIQTSDQALQDRIIRATNSQNKMSPASLRMTDQIHRDIEELFKKVDLYYDRRKGFHRDQGRPIRKIISVNAVTQAIISILLQRPDDARARPGDYFKDDNRYESVFADSRIPVGAYLSCVQIMQRVEQFLSSRAIGRGDEKNLKFYVAAMLAREVTGLAQPVQEKLPVASKIDEKAILGCYHRVHKVYAALSQQADKDAVARGTTLLKRLNTQWKRGMSR